MPISNEVKDLARAVRRLDEHASTAEGMAVIDGQNWTLADLRISVAWSIGYVTAKAVRLSKVTKRDVSLMLAAHGASPFTIEQHARAIAAEVRADLGMHSWSGSI
jgi:hypothetical protein